MVGTENEKVILLVEDNPMDEELTLRALKKSKILNPVVVARDGVAALDYLFARGPHVGRSNGAGDIVAVDGDAAVDLPVVGAARQRRDLRIVVERQAVVRGLPRDRAIHGAGVDMRVAKPLRDRPRQRSLACP